MAHESAYDVDEPTDECAASAEPFLCQASNACTCRARPRRCWRDTGFADACRPRRRDDGHGQHVLAAARSVLGAAAREPCASHRSCASRSSCWSRGWTNARGQTDARRTSAPTDADRSCTLVCCTGCAGQERCDAQPGPWTRKLGGSAKEAEYGCGAGVGGIKHGDEPKERHG